MTEPNRPPFQVISKRIAAAVEAGYAGEVGGLGRAILCLCAVACGRVGYDPDPGGQGRADANDLASLTEPFASEPLDRVATAGIDEDDPSLTDDGLELYFNATDGAGDADILVMTRSAIDAAWSAPAAVTELSSDAYDSTPCVTGDGLTIWLASNRGAISTDIWVSTRDTRADAWGPPERVAALSSPAEEALGLRADARRIAIASDRASPGDFDLYLATRESADQPWSEPIRIAELSTPALEESPHLSGDGLTIYFASESGGSLDIYSASRPGLDEPFGPPTLLPGVNTAGLDSDPWLSADGRHILFVRQDSATWDIYEGRR